MTPNLYVTLPFSSSDLVPSEQFSRSYDPVASSPPRDTTPSPPLQPKAPERSSPLQALPPKPHPRSYDHVADMSRHPVVEEKSPAHSRTSSLPSNNSGKFCLYSEILFLGKIQFVYLFAFFFFFKWHCM